MYNKVIVGLFFYFLTLISQAGNLDNLDFAKEQTHAVEVNVFTISTCPHCQNALTFLKNFAQQNSWVNIHYYVINQDKQALVIFNNFLQEQGVDNFAVPAIFFCKSRWVGYKNLAQSGMGLIAGLNYCHNQLVKTGKLSATSIHTLQQMALANWDERNTKSTNKTTFFILLIAIIDALNPMALILVLILISFSFQQLNFLSLSNFIIGAGLAHYSQLGYLSSVQGVDISRLMAALVGLGLITYILSFLSQKINYRFKIVTMITAFLTAFIVQYYLQSASSPSFALIVNQELMNQQLSASQQIVFQLVYIFIYLLMLALIALIVAFLAKRASGQKYLLRFKRSGKLFLLIVGITLIIYPYALSNLFFTFISLLISILLTRPLSKV